MSRKTVPPKEHMKKTLKIALFLADFLEREGVFPRRKRR